jgi:hypothetical protein
MRISISDSLNQPLIFSVLGASTPDKAVRIINDCSPGAVAWRRSNALDGQRQVHAGPRFRSTAADNCPASAVHQVGAARASMPPSRLHGDSTLKQPLQHGM